MTLPTIDRETISSPSRPAPDAAVEGTPPSSSGSTPSLTPRRQPIPSAALSSRELGLDLALILARYLWKTDHLHYGYWTAGMPAVQ